MNSLLSHARLYYLNYIVLRRKFEHGLIGRVIWGLRGGQVPAPNSIKWRVLGEKFCRDAICVETGTYLGETTHWLQRNIGPVFSLEPQKRLYDFNEKRFRRNSEIKLFLGTSEERLEEVLSQIKNGSNVNFWLDGHFSGGLTYEGATGSPIIHELICIKLQSSRFRRIVIAIDDFRDFQMKTRNGYVDRFWLVNWASENGFSWDVRNDIFFMEKN